MPAHLRSPSVGAKAVSRRGESQPDRLEDTNTGRHKEEGEDGRRRPGTGRNTLSCGGNGEYRRFTGTPAGVGAVEPGDLIEGGIDSLGRLVTMIR
jgi:hypothetical protein